MKNKIKKTYTEYFWIFIIGSFIGFLHENLLTVFKGEIVIRQGLIYEPLIPIYGIGFLILYILYSFSNFYKNNKILSIFKGFLYGF